MRVSLFRNFIIHQIFSEFLQPAWFTSGLPDLSSTAVDTTQSLERCHFQYAVGEEDELEEDVEQ